MEQDKYVLITYGTGGITGISLIDDPEDGYAALLRFLSQRYAAGDDFGAPVKLDDGNAEATAWIRRPDGSSMSESMVPADSAYMVIGLGKQGDIWGEHLGVCAVYGMETLRETVCFAENAKRVVGGNSAARKIRSLRVGTSADFAGKNGIERWAVVRTDIPSLGKDNPVILELKKFEKHEEDPCAVLAVERFAARLLGVDIDDIGEAMK